MGCSKCGYSGDGYEYDKTAGPGYVNVGCPECKGVDSEEPRWVTEASDALTQEEMEAEGYTFAAFTPERIAFEVDVAWVGHGPAW